MRTIGQLLTPEEYEMYKSISHLNIKSSIYDITTACNLRCKGCFFYSSGEDKVGKQENDLSRWEDFVESEGRRGVNTAILIGGEPTLYPDRIEVFYKRMSTFVASNGLIKISRSRFPTLKIGVSIWGNEEIEKELRGTNCFYHASKNYAGDRHFSFLYTITPKDLGKTHQMIGRIRDLGVKTSLQLFSNDDHVEGYDWTEERLRDANLEMDSLLDCFPDTVISSKYYHQVLTTGKLLELDWGWMQCPSVSLSHDNRNPRPKRLHYFIRWASDLKSTHRCCTSSTRDCSECHDGGARMSWIMVNKKMHMESRKDFLNWLDVFQMYAKMYGHISDNLPA